MSLSYFPTDSDISVLWTGLANHATGSYINDATVTAVLSNAAGTTIQTITLSYVAASNGNYRGTITYGANLVMLSHYKLTVTAVSGSLRRRRVLFFPAKDSGGED